MLLVAKKVFIAQCAADMTDRLKDLGHHDVKVVTGDWESVDLTSSTVIPIINYGVIGVNLFEDFDCAYCLTGYYVNLPILNSILQDLLAEDFMIPIVLKTGMTPPPPALGRSRESQGPLL